MATTRKQKRPARKSAGKGSPAAAVLRHRLKSKVCPDALDLRDRPYLPAIALRPAPILMPDLRRIIKNQGNTSACTGFSLATVLEHLLDRPPRAARAGPSVLISGFMLYSMARRYDEFPGSPAKDSGSSLRGALKGWQHHGACEERLWRRFPMPTATNDPKTDWWLDAAKRPLGAYYRIDTRAITDMHVAISELGMIYASATAHAGWDRGYVKVARPAPRTPADIWVIPKVDAQPDDSGHAFALCGYTEQGFILQNSWTSTWGTGGYGVLTYEDWLANAMDCWVAQLGVVTEEHQAVASSTTLRIGGRSGAVQLASADILRNRELSPFIIDMGNNGQLSNAGEFRTGPGDIDALVSHHLAEARKKWGLAPSATVDVAVYAHGGLTGEDTAARTAARWVPALYNAQVFPVFLLWETDFVTTLLDLIADKIKGIPRTTGGFVDDARDQIKRWWNARLERSLAEPGSAIWGEMKQNADAISAGDQSGGVLLYQAFKNAGELKNIRLHLIGHSAGAIVHSFLIDRLARAGLSFESVSFMAPAVRVQTFENLVAPRLASGIVKRYRQFHLNDAAEQADPTCRPYLRSLLYLVSESFEGGVQTPILGMQTYFDAWAAANPVKNVEAIVAPGAQSKATTHGGFDDDDTTMRRVIAGLRP